jgi:hypothetical protein
VHVHPSLVLPRAVPHPMDSPRLNQTLSKMSSKTIRSSCGAKGKMRNKKSNVAGQKLVR